MELKNKNVFIIDWPDRSGKWTFIECLNNFLINNKWIHCSLYKDNIYSKYIEHRKWEYELSQIRVETQSFWQYELFETLTNEKNKVIVDRWFLTTICYNELRLNWKRNNTNEEWTIILYDHDELNDRSKEYYQNNYYNLLLIDNYFKDSSLLNIIMLPNIEEGKERCSTKREDEFDDIAKINYEILCNSYTDLSYLSKIDTLIFDFNEDKDKILIYLSKDWEKTLIEEISKTKYNLEDENQLKQMLNDFIEKHF